MVHMADNKRWRSACTKSLSWKDLYWQTVSTILYCYLSSYYLGQTNLLLKKKNEWSNRVMSCTTTKNVVELFHFFKQCCELYFSVQNILEENQVEHILLLSDEEDLQCFNLWKFKKETNKQNAATVWESL